jgi:uncharacterized membrane protein
MSSPAERPPADDVRVYLGVCMAIVAALTVIGLIATWPRGDAPEIGPQPVDYVDGTVVATNPTGECTDIEVGGRTDCVTYTVRLSSGPDKGSEVKFSVRPTEVQVPVLSDGDTIVLHYYPSSPVEFRYAFADYQRSTPMLWLLVAFIAVVLAFGRFQGFRALAGLGLSLVILVMFIVPALLRDSPAVLVALVGTAAVAFLAIYLAHGIGLASTIALAGTLVSLSVTCSLAVVAAALTQLSGLASEEAQTLSITAQALDLRGLLIAGIVIGALGVLDDVTVSQVSTVAALRRANPSLSARRLYHEANHVGRDHVASAVNTLVFAYAGASLPLLLFIAQGDQPIGRLLTGELMAVEIVRMLVGSIGLVIAVPVTTALAAFLLSHTSDVPDDDGHGHHGFHESPPDPVPEPATRQLSNHGQQPDPTYSNWPPPQQRDEPTEPWF